MGQLNPDPTFEEIEEAGGVVEKRGEGHAVAGGGVWVSGEIPRLTWFEEGLHIGAVRFFEEEGEAKGKWVLEQVSRCLISLCLSLVPMRLGFGYQAYHG